MSLKVKSPDLLFVIFLLREKLRQESDKKNEKDRKEKQ